MQKILAFFGSVALFLFMWGSCSSCKTLKTVSHQTKDSVIYKVRDSVVIKNHLRTKDSIIYRDSAIGIKRGTAGFSIPYNSTTDTIIKKGAITIRRTVNKGIETIDCDTDSLTILVSDLRSAYHLEQIENDRISSQFSDYKATHSETTVKAAKQGWFARAWLWVKNLCTLLVAIWLVLFILRRIFKF